MLQIPDLNAMFSGDPGAFGMGRRMLGLNEMFAQQNQQRAEQELALRRQQEERINRNTEGQLELQRQAAAERQRQWEEEAPTRELNRRKIKSQVELDELERPAKIAEIQSRIDQRAAKDQLERVRNLATGMNQAAEIAEMVGPAAAKAHLEKFKFEGWDPRWEDPKILSQEGLAKVLRDLGGRLSTASADFQQRLLMQNDKQEAAAALQAQRDAAALARVERQGQIRNILEENRRKATASRDPRNLEESATRLLNLARNEQDAEMRAFYTQQAALDIETAKFLRANTPERNIIDTSKVGGGALTTTGGTPPNPLQGATPPARPVTGNNPNVTPSSGSPAQDRPNRQAAQRPPTPERFNLEWATLKPGQSLMGPDGKMYTKK